MLLIFYSFQMKKFNHIRSYGSSRLLLTFSSIFVDQGKSKMEADFNVKVFCLLYSYLLLGLCKSFKRGVSQYLRRQTEHNKIAPSLFQVHLSVLGSSVRCSWICVQAPLVCFRRGNQIIKQSAFTHRHMPAGSTF